jgi:putative addiction module killer protein
LAKAHRKLESISGRDRIYYGLDGSDIILLVGGDKSTQRADIERAKAFWREYKERKREEKRRF